MLIRDKLKELKVLVVDDDHDDAILLKDFLEDNLGSYVLKVDFSFTYMEAIFNISENEYDLCLFDYHLGNTDGLELLESIRSRGFTMPIIFLTGNHNPSIPQKAMEAGATDLFYKDQLNQSDFCPSILHAIESYRDSGEHNELKELYNNSNIDVSSIICEISPEGETLFLNNDSCKITGYKVDEIIGEKWWEIFDTKGLALKVKAKARGNEKTIKTRDGQIKVLDWKETNNYDDNGVLQSIICIATDITKKVNLREKLIAIYGDNAFSSLVFSPRKEKSAGSIIGGYLM